MIFAAQLLHQNKQIVSRIALQRWIAWNKQVVAGEKSSTLAVVLLNVGRVRIDCHVGLLSQQTTVRREVVVWPLVARRNERIQCVRVLLISHHQLIRLVMVHKFECVHRQRSLAGQVVLSYGQRAYQLVSEPFYFSETFVQVRTWKMKISN